MKKMNLIKILATTTALLLSTSIFAYMNGLGGTNAPNASTPGGASMTGMPGTNTPLYNSGDINNNVNSHNNATGTNDSDNNSDRNVKGWR